MSHESELWVTFTFQDVPMCVFDSFCRTCIWETNQNIQMASTRQQDLFGTYLQSNVWYFNLVKRSLHDSLKWKEVTSTRSTSFLIACNPSETVKKGQKPIWSVVQSFYVTTKAPGFKKLLEMIFCQKLEYRPWSHCIAWLKCKLVEA